MKVGIAAAGSGGHVFPALAVADALGRSGLSKDEIIFFGGDRMEADTVPAAGYPFVPVEIHGIRRSLSTDNFTLPLKIRRATAVISDVIRNEGIDAMVVFGGYVAGPAGRAANRTNIPLIIHEANAVPGVANKLLAPSADTVFVAFEPAKAKFKNPILVGNPLREEFESFDRNALVEDARSRYQIPMDATVVGVFGGSLGAAALNDIALQIATDPSRNFEILHLTGAPHIDAVNKASTGVDGWTVVPFESEMRWFYAACDLVVSRGGALTVSELHATATPAIIVPLPAGKGYQGLNATDLVEAGGAILRSQDLRDDIVAEVFDLASNEPRRREMADTAIASRHVGVADAVAERVLELARDHE